MIARRYRVSAARLARANGLRLTSVITPGQRLRVPGRVATRPRTVRRLALFHTVRPGEGFFAIADRYRLVPDSLARANGLLLTSVLTPGQRLRIPGRTATVAAPVQKPKPVSTASGARHTVGAGESFFSIAQRYHVSPWRLARTNRLSLMSTIVPGQRLRLPRGAHLGSSSAPVGRDDGTRGDRPLVRARSASIRSSRALSRGWSPGFQQDVVSSAGAIGVMQLLPETWEWVDTMLLGAVTPRTYDGNVRAGVRYLRWQLDQFDGDVRLALAGYYQGARAVRERGPVRGHEAVRLRDPPALRLGLTARARASTASSSESAAPRSTASTKPAVRAGPQRRRDARHVDVVRERRACPRSRARGRAPETARSLELAARERGARPRRMSAPAADPRVAVRLQPSRAVALASSTTSTRSSSSATLGRVELATSSHSVKPHAAATLRRLGVEVEAPLEVAFGLGERAPASPRLCASTTGMSSRLGQRTHRGRPGGAPRRGRRACPRGRRVGASDPRLPASSPSSSIERRSPPGSSARPRSDRRLRRGS